MTRFKKLIFSSALLALGSCNGSALWAAVPLTVGGEWGTPLSLVARYGLGSYLTAEGAIGRRDRRWIENRAGFLFEVPSTSSVRPYTGLQATWGSHQKEGMRTPFGFHFSEDRNIIEFYAEFATVYHGAHSNLTYESGIGLLINPFALLGL